MNFDEIKLADANAIETRLAEIAELVKSNDENADFEALSAEVDALSERKAELEIEARKADIKAVLDGENTEEVKEFEIPKEERKMRDIMEVRSSKEYNEAYATYIKTGSDKECRAVLSELAEENGQVPVPTFIEELVRTNWEKEGLLKLVKKSYLKGIVKVGFEVSATGAVIHKEGAEAPSEEELVLGVVELKPESIKKWITISDELYDLSGERFLRYIYDEITYRIAKKAADTLVGLIDAASATATTSAVGVPVVEADQITIDLVAQAIGKLSDEATSPVIVMNKGTYAIFKAVAYANGYSVDPFEGLDVVFNNSIKSFADAGTGETYAIVGDFGYGAQANFPNGESIDIKFDDLSLAEQDLIKIVGRQYVGMNLVADAAFVKITKES